MKEAPGNAADWVKISGTVPRNFQWTLEFNKRRLKNTWENIKQSAADSAKSVGESFKNGFDNVKDWFKGVGKSISDVFTTAFDFVWKYIGPYVTGIKNAFKMVVNAMKANIENVKMIAENVVTILKMFY